MPVTVDRADIVHFAGKHRLSPAVRDGAPVLVGHGEPGERCGWADFFAAMGARGLAASFEPEDPGSFRFVPRGEVAAHPRGGPGPGRGAFAEARRFLAALLGRPPRP
jgi:hypothetical protein